MSQSGEGDLRDRFAALRREDAAGAPPFALPRAGAAPAHRPAARSWRAWTPAAAVLALLVVTAIALWRPRAPRRPLISLATTRWESPTDFLLQVPGAEYLTTVPRLTYRIGTIPDWRNP